MIEGPYAAECDHPQYCAEIGAALPGWRADGPFVDVAGDRTPHGRAAVEFFQRNGTWSNDPDLKPRRVRADDIVKGPLAGLLAEIDSLTTAKDEGYSGSERPWQAYRVSARFGGWSPMEAAMARYAEKHARLETIFSGRGRDRVGESLRETILDAAAILLIAVSLFDEADNEVHRGSR